MRIVFTAIEVHPQTLFDSNGAVRKWMVLLSAETKVAVKAKAPPGRSRAVWAGRKGTGNLRRSIAGNTARTGPLRNVSVVSVNVPYAEYVLGGTAYQGTRYIYRNYARRAEAARIAQRVGKGGKAGPGTRGLYMRLPLTNVGGRRIYHLRVHGQRANNFLFDGYNVVARKHRALGVLRNPYAF